MDTTGEAPARSSGRTEETPEASATGRSETTLGEDSGVSKVFIWTLLSEFQHHRPGAWSNRSTRTAIILHDVTIYIALRNKSDATVMEMPTFSSANAKSTGQDPALSNVKFSLRASISPPFADDAEARAGVQYALLERFYADQS